MFILQENPIEHPQLKILPNPALGALVSFEGIVRADRVGDRLVQGLLYVADEAAVRQEGEKIIHEAKDLFSLTEALCIQRIGHLKVTETAVWVGAWAPHRDGAFKGCRYIIEEVKKRLLIWKKDFYNDGSSAWVHGIPVVNS